MSGKPREHEYENIDEAVIMEMQKVLPPLPNCAASMQAKFIAVDPANRSMTISFPVLSPYLNPAGSMQGGYITAAFDNVFGPLSIMVTGKHAVTTLDINSSFHRPIYADDELIITAHAVYVGNTRINLFAEALNREGQMIATATSNMMVIKSKTDDKKTNDHKAKE